MRVMRIVVTINNKKTATIKNILLKSTKKYKIKQINLRCCGGARKTQPIT